MACLFVEKVKYYGVDAEEGGHKNSDEQRLEGKAEQIEKKDETGNKNRFKRAATMATTTEEQKDDDADPARKLQNRKYSRALKGKGKGTPEKSESDKLLEKYFAGMHYYYNDFLLAHYSMARVSSSYDNRIPVRVPTAVDIGDASQSSLPCSSSSSSSATAGQGRFLLFIYSLFFPLSIIISCLFQGS